MTVTKEVCESVWVKKSTESYMKYILDLKKHWREAFVILGYGRYVEHFLRSQKMSHCCMIHGAAPLLFNTKKYLGFM